MKTRFGHFLEFGPSDGLDIAYHDSSKCFSAFGHGNSSCIINQSFNNFFPWSKRPFLTLSRFWRKSIKRWRIYDDLIRSYRVSVNCPRKRHVQERSGWFLRCFFVWRVGCFEWSIQLLAVFWSLVHLINLILHILIILTVLNNLTMISLLLDLSKISKCIFEWSKEPKKMF